MDNPGVFGHPGIFLPKIFSYVWFPVRVFIHGKRKIDVQLKNSTAFLLLGAVGLGVWLLRKAGAALNLVFSPGDIVSAGLEGTNPYINFEVVAQNTSGATLLMNSFAGNLYANNVMVGNVSNFSPVEVTGNASTAIPLTVRLLPLGIVNDLIQSIQQRSFLQNLLLDGTANLNGVQVPVKVPFSVGA